MSPCVRACVQLRNDPGTQYTNNEFKEFSKEWGFESKPFSATYSQANGRAEKAVQIAKNLLKKAKRDGNDIQLALLDYRNTPRDFIVGSPAQRCMGRRTRTRLPMSNSLLEPKNIQTQIVTNRLEEFQLNNQANYNKSAKPLEKIQTGDSVRYRTGKTWTPAELISENDTNPRSYKIKTPAGNTIVRNRRHLLKTNERENYIPAQQHHEMSMVEDNILSDNDILTNVNVPVNENIPVEIEMPINDNITVREPILTRSGRNSKPPSYLKDYVR